MKRVAGWVGLIGLVLCAISCKERTKIVAPTVSLDAFALDSLKVSGAPYPYHLCDQKLTSEEAISAIDVSDEDEYCFDRESTPVHETFFFPEKDIKNTDLVKKVQQFWEEEIKALEDAGKIGSAGKYKYCLSLLSQCNPVNIPFDSITVPYLKKFQQFLQSKGNCANSIATKFSVFQALYNKAISAGVFVCVNNPFEKISTPWKNTKIRAIRKEDIQAIINLNIPESRDTYSLSFARDIFLFSYYSAGINFTDIASLRPPNIKNGIVHYQRHKTGKSMCFPITEHNVVILNKYMPFPKTEGYIFSILDSEKH